MYTFGQLLRLIQLFLVSGRTLAPDLLDLRLRVLVRIDFRLVGMSLDHILYDLPFFDLLSILSILQSFIERLIYWHVSVYFWLKSHLRHL